MTAEQLSHEAGHLAFDHIEEIESVMKWIRVHESFVQYVVQPRLTDSKTRRNNTYVFNTTNVHDTPHKILFVRVDDPTGKATKKVKSDMDMMCANILRENGHLCSNQISLTVMA